MPQLYRKINQKSIIEFTGQPSSVAFAARSELGLDLHYRASIRFYAAAEHLGTSHDRIQGFGGGLQVGLTL